MWSIPGKNMWIHEDFFNFIMAVVCVPLFDYEMNYVLRLICLDRIINWGDLRLYKYQKREERTIVSVLLFR